MSKRATKCRHCRIKPVNRPRGLCGTCYDLPTVREQHPSQSKFAQKGCGMGFRPRPLPCRPTEAPPGSPEKVEVLAKRAAREESLWHPDDAQPELLDLEGALS